MDVEIMNAVERAGYQLSSVPKRGEKLYLRKKTNVSSGGDPIDVLDTIPEEYKQVAIQAVNAFPGLLHAGVDIMIHRNKKEGPKAVVIELNATAQIGGALFPLRGKPRDVPKAIIDYYFPETKGIDTSTSRVYFDMINVLEPLENRAALEVEVTPAPMGKLYAKKFIVHGTVQRQRYHQWLKKEALDLGLNGYIKNRVFDEIEIVAAGTDKAKLDQFKEKITGFNKSVKITKVEEEMHHEPVTVGFEIAERYNTSSQRSVQNALNKMEKELKTMTKQKDRLEKDNQHILNSNSWKWTEPVRKIGAAVKKQG
jgi:acylphosphatase